MTRIDAHQHFWRLARGDYAWLESAPEVLRRDYLPEDLKPRLEAAGIAKTIAVQAAPTQDESRFLLDLADRHEFIAGVVGWAPLDEARAVRDLEGLARSKKLVGVRPMMESIAHDRWMLERRLEPALRWISERGLVFDALVLPRHLGALAVFLDTYHELRVVVDHAAKPVTPRQRLVWPGEARWRHELRVVARHPNAFCKLSGLVTETARPWTAEMLRSVVDWVLDCFGPQRVIWGSDWPVLLGAGSYEDWVRASEELLAGLPEADRLAIFGGNAARVYRLEEGEAKSQSAPAGKD